MSKNCSITISLFLGTILKRQPYKQIQGQYGADRLKFLLSDMDNLCYTKLKQVICTRTCE